MELEKKDGEWLIQDHPLHGEKLAYAIKHGYSSHLIERHLGPQQAEKLDAIDAEIERQRTWGCGCVKCGTRTLHDSNGCIECQRRKER